MKTIKLKFVLSSLIVGLGLMPVGRVIAQTFTFGPEIKSTPSASITYISTTGKFQYTDAANSSDDSAISPLTGAAATLITISNDWTASININISARSMTASVSESPHAWMYLGFDYKNGSSTYLLTFGLQQENNTGGANDENFPDSFYGTEADFRARTNGNDDVTTPLGASQDIQGGSVLVLSGAATASPASESVNAVTATLTLSYNASSNTVTGYCNGTPVGSYSLAGWGASPKLTLFVGGSSGQGVGVPAGTDTGSNFYAGILPSALPTLVITSPKKNATVTAASLTVTGTTHDNAAVTNVVVELNGVALTTVASSNGFANWTAAVTNLPPGTNTLHAYAVNTNGETSATTSVTLFYKSTAELAANYTGHGSLSPNDNGKALDINVNYTIKGVPASGFGFFDWTVTGATTTSSLTDATLTFQMVSNLQLTANFVDTQKPTVAFTTKAGTGSNAVVVISGTAKDNVGVAFVWCRVGSGGWILAATGNEYTNWTASVILSAGTNTIQVYAVDAAGNPSLTNSVILHYNQAGFAPESLAGTMLQVVNTSNSQSAVLGFYGASFSQVGSNGATTGVGLYIYSQSDTNTGQLATTFTAPPMTVSNTLAFEDIILSYDVFALSFTNGTSGTWDDTNGDSGTFTLNVAPNTAPASLDGLTVQGADTGTNVYAFTNEYGNGTLTTMDTYGDSSGTYTYEPYSPIAGLLQVIFTNGPDLGTTNYVLLDYSAGSADTYYGESDTASGTNTSAGVFTVGGETSTAGYTAPASLDGLTGAATGAVSHMFSFGASTYGDFSAGTAHANKDVSDVGTYTYTRTGPKTAVIQTIDFAPPEEAQTNSPVLLYFTSAHNANIGTAESQDTITFSSATSTVPLSLVGKKFTGNGQAGAITFGYGIFTGSGDLTGVEGTYTYMPYGPQVAMAILSFTAGNGSGTAPGTTWYMEMWFSSSTGGSADINYFTADGAFSNLTTGTFTMH